LRLGIKILPPNVNYSEEHFSIIKKDDEKSMSNGESKFPNDAIVFGLGTIKNLGQNAVEEIVRQRKVGGKFKNLSDFIRRIDMKTTNKKSLEALINSGAFDSFGDRSEMFLNIEDILAYQRQNHDTHAAEVSLFSEMADISDLRLKPVQKQSRNTVLKLERELLGLYLSGHPLDPWKDILKNRHYNVSKIMQEVKADTNVDFAGIITGVKTMLTKKKDKMAFLTVADLDGDIEVVVFPKAYELFKDKILPDTPLLIKGRVSLKNKEEGENSDESKEKKVRDDGTEAKTYANKAIILEELRNL
jgi:DNA polymerase-3 subunit alpha